MPPCSITIRLVSKNWQNYTKSQQIYQNFIKVSLNSGIPQSPKKSNLHQLRISTSKRQISFKKLLENFLTSYLFEWNHLMSWFKLWNVSIFVMHILLQDDIKKQNREAWNFKSNNEDLEMLEIRGKCKWTKIDGGKN